MDTLPKCAIASIQAGIDPELWTGIIRPEILSSERFGQLMEVIEGYQDSLNPDSNLHQHYHVICGIWLDHLSARQIELGEGE